MNVKDVYGIYDDEQLHTSFFNKEDAKKWIEHILSTWGPNGGPIEPRGYNPYHIRKMEIFESFDDAVQTCDNPCLLD